MELVIRKVYNIKLLQHKTKITTFLFRLFFRENPYSRLILDSSFNFLFILSYIQFLQREMPVSSQYTYLIHLAHLKLTVVLETKSLLSLGRESGNIMETQCSGTNENQAHRVTTDFKQQKARGTINPPDLQEITEWRNAA